MKDNIRALLVQARHDPLDALRLALEKQSKGSPQRGSSPCLPDANGLGTSHVTPRNTADKTKQQSAQNVWREVPLPIATSLRGRGL